MEAQYNKVTAKIATAQNVFMSVFFAESAVFGVMSGLEGGWLGWFIAIVFFYLGVSVITGNLSYRKIHSVTVNVVFLIIIGLGIFSMGMLILDGLVLL